ncbi:hypothetical protein C8Q77DRAFT_1159769 [Trametes polyzona]|nr:hypothetical protein C8Q77DRAFT_1159769 [Trametes polyzona]
MHALHDDKATIITCTYVSALWRSIAHPHLFASLKYNRKTGRFEDLRDFLDAHPDIARCVRTLELVCSFRGYITDITRTGEWDKGPNVDRALLATIVGRLPRLQELHLTNIWLVGPFDDGGQAVEASGLSAAGSTMGDVTSQPPPYRLQKLVLDWCSGPGDPGGCSLAALTDILSLFTSILYLELHWTKWADNSTQPQNVSPRALLAAAGTLQVRTLVGEGLTKRISPVDLVTESLCQSFRQLLAPSCIRELRLVDGNGGPWTLPRSRAFGEFVAHAATRAQHIFLPFWIGLKTEHGPDDPEHWRAFNLHTLTSLTSLALTFHFPPRESPASAGAAQRDVASSYVARVCAALLAHVPSTPGLRLLTLELRGVRTVDDVKRAQRIALGALDAAFAQSPHARTLQQVEAVLAGWGKKEDLGKCTAAMRKAMPRLGGKRGLLRVSQRLLWIQSPKRV